MANSATTTTGKPSCANGRPSAASSSAAPPTATIALTNCCGKRCPSLISMVMSVKRDSLVFLKSLLESSAGGGGAAAAVISQMRCQKEGRDSLFKLLSKKPFRSNATPCGGSVFGQGDRHGRAI